MPVKCKICECGLSDKDKLRENLVLCEHKGGFVHRSCCVSECSMHGAPCSHAVYEYERLDNEHASPEMFKLID